MCSTQKILQTFQNPLIRQICKIAFLNCLKILLTFFQKKKYLNTITDTLVRKVSNHF